MKKAGIHGFTDPNKTPSQIMEKIISGKCKAPLLSNLFSITAYIPTMKQGNNVATIMRVTTRQSELISKNKQASAVRSLSTNLAAWLAECETMMIRPVTGHVTASEPHDIADARSSTPPK